MSFKSSTLLLLSAAGIASADLSDPNQFVYLNESPAALIEAGFDDLTGGSPLQVVEGNCFRCYTFETLDTTSTKGFIEVNITAGLGFLEDGAFVVLDILFPGGFGPGGITQSSFIDLVNGGGGGGDIIAQTTSDAGNETSQFDDWIDQDFDDSTVFNFDPIPFAPGSSVSFTFAWDFTTDANPLFAGISVDGLGTTPAPGALALLGLAGLGRRRRQH